MHRLTCRHRCIFHPQAVIFAAATGACTAASVSSGGTRVEAEHSVFRVLCAPVVCLAECATHCSIVVHGHDTLLLSRSATVAKRQQPPPFWEAALSLRTLDEDGAVDVCRLQRRDECVQLWLRGICVRKGHVRQLPRHLRPRPAACTGAAVAGCLPAL